VLLDRDKPSQIAMPLLSDIREIETGPESFPIVPDLSRAIHLLPFRPRS